MDALSGIEEDGSENFPGWSLDALKYIYEVRKASANGHETLDTDASVVAPAGAVIIVSYPRIEGATGLPARVWAITE